MKREGESFLYIFYHHVRSCKLVEHDDNIGRLNNPPSHLYMIYETIKGLRWSGVEWNCTAQNKEQGGVQQTSIV
jgi:hypothetical protein